MEKVRKRSGHLDLVRLAFPRRSYTQSHMDYVIEALGEIQARRASIGGLRMALAPKVLRHFTAHYEPA